MHTFEASLEVNLIDSQMTHYKTIASYTVQEQRLPLYRPSTVFKPNERREKDDKQKHNKKWWRFLGATAN